MQIVTSKMLASNGYHIYKTTTSWINPKVGDKVTVELETTTLSLETDPYACLCDQNKKQVLP